MDSIERQALVDLLFTSTERSEVLGHIGTFLAEAGTESDLLHLANQLIEYPEHQYAARVVRELIPV